MKPPIDADLLDRECSVFCRYLIGQKPDDYVKRKYWEAHRDHTLSGSGLSNRFDSLLVKIAGISPWTTKPIDVYARVFQPHSLVRKKLILLLAILESCAPTYEYLDIVDSANVLRFFMASFQRCFIFAVLLLVATVAILPIGLVVRGGLKVITTLVPRHG